MKKIKGINFYIDTDYIKSNTTLGENYKDYNLIIGDVEVCRADGSINIQCFIVDGIEDNSTETEVGFVETVFPKNM